MADIITDIDPKKAIFYNPDLHAPDRSVLRFPPTSSVPDGHRIKLIESANSRTEVVYLAQGSDTIANPLEPTQFGSGWKVSVSNLIAEYMKFGTLWRVSAQANPDFVNEAAANFAFAAYGGLQLDAATAVGDDIGLTWDTINQFDAVSFVTPRAVAQNLVNSSLTLLLEGVWRIEVTVSFTHNESNQGRQTGLRLYNLTDGVEVAPGLIIPIARNQPGSLITASFIIEVDSASINKEIVLQLGGYDSVTSVVFNSLVFQMSGVGEFRGTVDVVNPYP